MIQAVIFDFGNVVAFFDHSLIIQRLSGHTEVPAETIRGLIIGSTLEDDYEKGRITSAEFLRQVRETCRFGCPDEVMTTAYCEIFWPNPDVCALVPRLKPRYRLLLGSNTTELHSRHFRQQFADTLKHFDALVLSHDVGARKPSAEFFQHCVRLARCEPHECLFIDDLAANVAGAKAAGLQGVVYTGFAGLCKELVARGVVLE